MALTQTEEAGLIERIRAGEKELFHDLIRPYERAVYLTLFSMLRNPADAEDAAQETMLKAYRALPHFRSEAKFGTWITAIALNEGRNRLDRSSRRHEHSIDEDAEQFAGDRTPALLTDWRPIPSEALEHKELRMQLEQAIASLPAAYRETFTLRDMEGMEVEEIAKLLQTTSNVVRVRLHRARSILQKELVPVLKNFGAKEPRRWFRRWSL